LKTDIKAESIWLTQEQIASIFDVQKAAISKHLKNIFYSGELVENSVVFILETTAKDIAFLSLNKHTLRISFHGSPFLGSDGMGSLIN
jgi:hypothetical protein